MSNDEKERKEKEIFLRCDKIPTEIRVMNFRRVPENLKKFREEQIVSNGVEFLESFVQCSLPRTLNGDIQWLKENGYKLTTDNYEYIGGSGAEFRSPKILLYPFSEQGDYDTAVSTYTSNLSGERMVPVKLVRDGKIPSMQKYVFAKSEDDQCNISKGVPTTDLGFLEALFSREDFLPVLKTGTVEQISEIFKLYCVDLRSINRHQLSRTGDIEAVKSIIAKALPLDKKTYEKLTKVLQTKRS